MDKIKVLLNWLADNGLPLPLLRHNGRGDLIATLAVLGFALLGLIALLGGSHVTLMPGALIASGEIKVPELQSVGSSLIALAPALGGLIAYVVKRKQDLELGSAPCPPKEQDPAPDPAAPSQPVA